MDKHTICPLPAWFLPRSSLRRESHHATHHTRVIGGPASVADVTPSFLKLHLYHSLHHRHTAGMGTRERAQTNLHHSVFIHLHLKHICRTDQLDVGHTQALSCFINFSCMYMFVVKKSSSMFFRWLISLGNVN